jgi:hypothetical protein
LFPSSRESFRGTIFLNARSKSFGLFDASTSRAVSRMRRERSSSLSEGVDFLGMALGYDTTTTSLYDRHSTGIFFISSPSDRQTPSEMANKFPAFKFLITM